MAMHKPSALTQSGDSQGLWLGAASAGPRDADVRPNLGHHMQHLSDRDDVVATQWPRMECVGASTSMVSVAIFASASRAGTAQQVVRMITNSWAIMRT